MDRAGRVIITHGTGGSPEGNWFPWLGGELRRRGVQALIPRYPTPQGQSLESWLTAFDSACGSLRSGDILVGHSIGAAFALRLLERSAVPVAACLLAAGFVRQLGLEAFDPLNASFVSGPFDWAAIRGRSRSFVCWHGSDDPYVPLAFGMELAGALLVSPRIVPRGGHLNAKSGHLRFPELLSCLEDLLNQQAP